MDGPVIIIWFALLAAASAKESDSTLKRVMEGVSEELRSYMTDDSHRFFEVLMGEKLHQVYDFRVVIGAKALQCYYQEAEPKALITAHFECLNSPSLVSSAKMSATLVEISKSDDILSTVENKRAGELQIATEKTGTYGFCFDNGMSSSPATVQIMFDIWRLGEVPKFHAAELASNNTMYHAFDRLFQVTNDVALMRSSMTHTRSTLMYDYSTRMSNLSRITNFSLLSIVLILSVCFVQLHVVKNMFGSQRNTV